MGWFSGSDMILPGVPDGFEVVVVGSSIAKLSLEPGVKGALVEPRDADMFCRYEGGNPDANGLLAHALSSTTLLTSPEAIRKFRVIKKTGQPDGILIVTYLF